MPWVTLYPKFFAIFTWKHWGCVWGSEVSSICGWHPALPLILIWIRWICGCSDIYSDKLDEANKLKLNPDKTEILLVNRVASQGLQSQSVLDWVLLPLKKQICSMGALSDLSLQMKAQISFVICHTIVYVFCSMQMMQSCSPALILVYRYCKSFFFLVTVPKKVWQ